MLLALIWKEEAGYLSLLKYTYQITNAHGHRNCPVGGRPFQASEVRGIISFDEVVDSLEVYCSRTEGCNWMGTLKMISSHQQHCLHKPVQCTHHGCSQTFPCGQMQRHPGECDMHPQVCVTAELRCPSSSTMTTRSWHAGRPV